MRCRARTALASRTPADDQQQCGLAREAVRAGDRSKISVLLQILVKPGSNGHTHAAESLFKQVKKDVPDIRMVTFDTLETVPTAADLTKEFYMKTMRENIDRLAKALQ